MKKCSKTISKVLTVAVLILLTSLTALAQTVVTGRVTNSVTGAGVPGVTVTVKGTTTSTQTGDDGSYRIAVPSTNARLVFTSVGYTAQEVSAANAGTIRFVEASRQMEDVVVVAYGTRKKTDLTGSVTAVSAKDFQKGNIASSEQLLQGKVAGLEITTGGGYAGGGSKIRIRGGASLNASNEVLIVIDDVPVEGNGPGGNLLNTINPNDIESMSVLKDASATVLYGSRASNGVIIITTKKGTSNKPVFNFNTKVSYGKIFNKVKVLTGDDIRSIVNASGNNAYIKMLGKENTDWQDQIYQGAMGFDNNLSFSGRQAVTENFRLPYRISLGYLTQEGTLKTDKFNRLSAALNLSPKFLNDHISVNLNAKFAKTDRRVADGGAVGTAVGFDPTQPVMSTTNKYGGYWEWVTSTGAPLGLAPRNPVGLLMLRNNTGDLNRFIGNIKVDYKLHFFPDLHFIVNLGMDKVKENWNNVLDSTSVISTLSYQGKGSLNKGENTGTNKLADIQLFYQKDLGKGNKIDFLAGHSYQEFFNEGPIYPEYFQNGEVYKRSSVYEDYRDGSALESYLGRLNVTLSDKYLFTASVRRDASSRILPENRNAIFPGLAFAWKMKDDLFPNNNLINELKLRLGWGVTGNQDGLSNNGYSPIYWRGEQNAQYQFGNNFYYNYRPVAYNPDLKWEQTQTSNIGLDYGFAKNRISGAIDLYYKKTKDLLASVNVSPGSNYDIKITKNIGNMENKGVEFSLNTVPVRNSKVVWDFGFNFTYQSTKITKLFDATPGFQGVPVSGIQGGTGNNIGVHAVGYSPYTFLPYTQVYDASGLPIEGLYNDLNRDGVITDAGDRNYYKKPAPDYLMGFSTNVTLGKFSVGLTGHGMVGNYVYNNFNSNSAVLRNILNPVLYVGNAGVNYQETKFSNNRYLSDYYIENGSFFRFDNLNLGYNFGKIINKKAALRLNASIQNLFLITKYSGNDPEMASDSGVDNLIYPRPRVFSFGANLDF